MAYKQAIAINPKSVEAQAAIGDVRLQQQDYLAALVAYEEVIKLAPENAGAYYNLGLAFKGRDRRQRSNRSL